MWSKTRIKIYCFSRLFISFGFKIRTMSKIETKLIHSGEDFNTTRSVVPPIYQSATYFADSDPEQYIIAATESKFPTFYHRHGNPTNSQVAKVLADLEQTEDAIVLSTGMAAISSAILTVVKSGDHIIVQNSHYSGASLLFKDFLPDYNIKVTAVDQSDNQAFEKAIQDNTKMIYLESPSNPNLAISDLEYIGKLARSKGILTMIDNTFASPINQTPAAYGIDVIIHSATKYLGGHSDLTAGAICGSHDFIAMVWSRMLMLGGNLAPMDSFLLLRGLKTLKMRVSRINENALTFAQWLEKQPEISKVIYTGLESHPQHLLARKQMSGHTGMLSVELAGKNEEETFKKAQHVLRHLEVFANAASLGGVESLIVHPASMWGSHHNESDKKKSGITKGMLRISIGIEHIDDLIADFKKTLASI